jgi:hypothetical protein
VVAEEKLDFQEMDLNSLVAGVGGDGLSDLTGRRILRDIERDFSEGGLSSGRGGGGSGGLSLSDLTCRLILRDLERGLSKNGLSNAGGGGGGKVRLSRNGLK